jgi:alkylation response protein AidB-like acyl-CoA dehydrogenase
MDFKLTDQQIRLQQIARDFAYQEVRPLARQRDRETDPIRAFAPELVRRASELGLRTLKIPVEHGGLGADCLTEVIVLEELSVGDVGFGMTLAHAWREGYILARFTTDEQRRRFLPEFMADDTYLTCFAITEEHAGSDHGLPYDGDLEAGVRTSAVLDGDEWVINGRKRFITNGNVARMVILWARTDFSVPWSRGTSAFLVPNTAPGFGVGPSEDKFGLRTNQNTQLIFENCRVPEDNLLGELNGGYEFRERVGPGSKAKEAARELGCARAAYEEAVAWARERVQGGTRLLEHQSISTSIGEMAMEIELARTLLWRAAWAVDHDPARARPLEDMAKLYTSEMAVRTAIKAMQLFGARGSLRDWPMEKLVRDAATISLPPIGNQAVRVRLGRWAGQQLVATALQPGVDGVGRSGEGEASLAPT